MTDDTQKIIYQRAIALLARREHSQHELLLKLKKNGFDLDQIHFVLHRLVNEGLQSDDRFAENYVLMRARRGFGPLRIQEELRDRGIAATLVAQVLQAQEALWVERMLQVKQKKFGAHVSLDVPAKLKQMRFLQYRGFTHEQINTAFSED